MFTGNPLDRSSEVIRRFDGGVSGKDEISLIVVAGREICTRVVADPDMPNVLHDLQALLLGCSDNELDLNSEQICLNWREWGEAGGR